MMKNHCIAPFGMSAAPFGVTHRWKTTSRIEYSDDVKIEAIPARPTADRIGAFAGRVSRPRSRNGRTRSAITGMPLSRSPQNAALNSAFRGVPSPNVNCGKMSVSLTCSISMDTSVGLRDPLQPDEPHVQDDQSDHNQRQDEHVEPVEPEDVHAGQGVDVAEQQAGELVADHRGRTAHVDPDVRGALAQVVRGQQVPGVAERQGEQEQDDTQEPVQLAGLLVCACEVHAAHVEEDRGNHDVRGPVVHAADDEPERDVVHDDEHGTPRGVRQVTRRADFQSAVGDIEEAKQDARDCEDDERNERNSAEAVERVPVPDRLQLVLLRMAPWHLPLVHLDDNSGQVRVRHGGEAGLDPAEDRAPRVFPDVPRGRHVPPQQYTYQFGSAMPPTRFRPCAWTGITGRARGAGPCTRSAPTYFAPLLSFTFTMRTMGSYWEPWQTQ